MAKGRNAYYSIGHDEAYTDRLFGAGYLYRLTPLAGAREFAPASARDLLSVTPSGLHIPPFEIRKWGQVFISPETVVIDLERLPPAIYKIIVIHNFRVEDCNPRLNECLAGIFLARQIGRCWEEAEDHPIECRSIEVLGYVDTITRQLTPP